MFTLALLIALCPVAQVSVFRVAPGGAGTHSTIQAAIDAAVDGDIILVDSAVQFTGSPASATINGLSVTIIGDGPTPPELPVFVVENLPADGAVVLRNLEFASNPVDIFTAGVLTIRNCEGTVLVEDCVINGFDSVSVEGGVGGPGLFISGCDGVSVVRSTITGGHGTSTALNQPIPVIFPGPGGRALRVVGSRVSLHDCHIAGGHGGSDLNLFQPGKSGGLGLDVNNAQLWVVGCTVIGGDGGVGLHPGTSNIAAQIDGFDAPTSDFRQLDSEFIGGAGMPGLVVLISNTTQLPGAAVTFSLSSPVRPGDTAQASVQGPPGTLFGVFLSASPGFLPIANFNGVLVTDIASFSGPLLITNVPASGDFEVSFSAPNLGGLEGFLSVGQVISQQPGAGLVLSNASAWVQVDDGL